MDSDDDIQIIQEMPRKAKRRKKEPPKIVNFISDEQFFHLPSSSKHNYANSQNACDKLKLLQTELEGFQKCVQEESSKSNGMIHAEFVQKRITLLLNILQPTDQELQRVQYKTLKSNSENIKDPRIQFWHETTSFPSLRVNGPFERDVDIICKGGAIIPVHSDVLIASSNLLKGHLQGERQPQDTVILLPDHSPDVVTAVLDCIYTGSSSVPRSIINDVWELMEYMKIVPQSNIDFGPSTSEEIAQVSFTSTYLNALNLNSETLIQPQLSPPETITMQPLSPLSTTMQPPSPPPTTTTIATIITNIPSPSSVPQESSNMEMEIDVDAAKDKDIQPSTQSLDTNNTDDIHNHETEKITYNNNNNNNNNSEIGDEMLRAIEQQLEEMHSPENARNNEQVNNNLNNNSNNTTSPSESLGSVLSPDHSVDDDHSGLEEEEEEEEEKEAEEENSPSHHSNSIRPPPKICPSLSPSPPSVTSVVKRCKPTKRGNRVKLYFSRGGIQSEAWRLQLDEQSIPSSPSSVASICSKLTDNTQTSMEDWPDLTNSSDDHNNEDDDDDDELLSDSMEILTQSSEECQQPVLCCYSSDEGWALYQDRAQKYYAPVETLTELSRHIDSLSKYDPDLLAFPTHYFAFGAGNLSSPDASKFFTKYGKIIKKLEIDLIPTQEFHSRMLPPDSIQRVLTVQAPNVEYLEFLLPDAWKKVESCPSVFPDYDGKLKKVNLESVTNLKIHLGKFFPGYNNFLKEMLAATPNLKNYGNENIFTNEGMDSQYLKTFMALGKTRTIRDFDFEPTEKNIKDFELFAQTFKFHESHKKETDHNSSSSFSSNQLRALGIDIRKHKKTSPLWFQLISILNVLLKSNKHSLKVLIISGSISTIPFPKSLKLPNLKVLQILIVRKNAILPKNFQIDKFFPNLSTLFLDLSFLKEKKMKFTHSFPDLNPVPSVKCVRILCTNYMSPGEIIKSLPSAFPNLEKLVVVNLYHFQNVAPIIWNHLEMLKYLDLTIIVFPNGSTCHDTIFTGLSKEEYVDVQKKIDKMNEQEMSELNRANPSIIKLKALKNLWVRFHGTFKRSSVNFPHLLTKVSKKLAFDLMPDLHVEFSIDQLQTDDRKISKLETSDDESCIKDRMDKLCVEKELKELGTVNHGLGRPYGETAVQYLLSL